MTSIEIITLLGGPNATARFFGVQPPSVSGWIKQGEIPESRLIEKAAELESVEPGKFSRRDQWPEKHRRIWPELAAEPPGSEPAPLPVAAAGC